MTRAPRHASWAGFFDGVSLLLANHARPNGRVTNESFGRSELKQTESVLNVTRRRRPSMRLHDAARTAQRSKNRGNWNCSDAKGHRVRGRQPYRRRHLAILGRCSDGTTFGGSVGRRPRAILGAAFERAGIGNRGETRRQTATEQQSKNHQNCRNTPHHH